MIQEKAEQKEMREVMELYAKAYHLRQVDCGDTLLPG